MADEKTSPAQSGDTATVPMAHSANGVVKKPRQYAKGVTEDCFQIYKLMGPGRTLKRLAEHVAKKYDHAPNQKTLKNWSAQYEWTFQVLEFDRETAKGIDAARQKELIAQGAKELGTLAAKMRDVSAKALNKLSKSIDGMKIKSGNEFRAVAEASVALNKAAEVLDGGVSDRTETVRTVEERQSAAQDLVDQAFKKFTGNDNGKRTPKVEPMDNAGDAGRGAGEVQRDAELGRGAA